MRSTRRREFSRDFKLAAVRIAKEGDSQAEAARALGLTEGQLYKWAREVQQKGDRAFPGNGRPQAGPGSAYQLMRDNLRLREECRVLRETVRIRCPRVKLRRIMWRAYWKANRLGRNSGKSR